MTYFRQQPCSYLNKTWLWVLFTKHRNFYYPTLHFSTHLFWRLSDINNEAIVMTNHLTNGVHWPDLHIITVFIILDLNFFICAFRFNHQSMFCQPLYITIDINLGPKGLKIGATLEYDTMHVIIAWQIFADQGREGSLG